MDGRQSSDTDTARVGPTRWLAALRGLAVGVASTGAGVLVGFAVIELTPTDDGPCDSDLVCLPDLGPVILVVSLVAVVIALAGPLVAHLLGIRHPALFALPSAWAVVVACVGLGPADRQDQWPFNDLVSSLLILWIPYSLIALWVSWRKADQGPSR